MRTNPLCNLEVSAMKRHLPVVLGLAAAVSLGACFQGVQDLDRTQANAIKKDMFQGTTWYFQQTIVHLPATDTSNFIGVPSVMEKIRWDIQESVLLAYRAYELIPGSDPRVDPASRQP